MMRIIVETEKEKAELIAAFRQFHDSDIDTDVPWVNLIAHLYLVDILVEKPNEMV